MSEITHKQIDGRMVQIVSAQRLKEILDRDGCDYRRPVGFHDDDEWDVGVSDYRDEFSDYDPASLPPIPANWVDNSWHNDACPSWAVRPGVLVYVDYANPAMREMEGGTRFHVQNDEGEVLFDSDDWDAILTFVGGRR